jgi:ribonuclease HI
MKTDLHLLEGCRGGIAVDASCLADLGSKRRDGYFHGRVEWQAVALDSGEKLFVSHIQQRSTINIGEFCALVDGIKWLHDRDIHDVPVYSDSKYAIGWVAYRKTNTKLPRNEHTMDALHDMEEALAWLNRNDPRNPVLWWNKRIMGDCPADFGRKTNEPYTDPWR